MTSLAKIDEAIGAKERTLASAVDTKSKAIAAVDTIVEAIAALQSNDSMTAEQEAELTAKFAALKDARSEATKQADSVRNLESQLAELRNTRALVDEQIRQEASLNQSAPRQSLPGSGDAASANVRVAPLTDKEKDHDMVSWVRAKYVSQADKVPVATVLSGQGGYDNLRNDRMHAVVTTSNAASIVPPNQVRDRLIELLRAAVVVRQLPGLRTVPLLNGNLTMPRQATTSAATYIGEGTNAAKSNVTTDSIALSAKKLASVVVSSGELMRRSSPESDAMIRDDMVQSIARVEDSQFIRGAGSSTAPKGLKAYADATSSTQVIAANATVNLANVTDDLRKLMSALINADTPMLAPAFIMHPRTKLYLQFLRDGNGNYAFPEISAMGMLIQYPLFTTSQIPINLGGGTNASELYLVDASEFILADEPGLMLDVSDTAAYHDGSNVQAAFSLDQVVFRIIKGHDTQIRHPRSVAYLSSVLWGA